MERRRKGADAGFAAQAEPKSSALCGDDMAVLKLDEE